MHTSYYKLKADAPDEAVESISKKLHRAADGELLADGAIAQYEVDEEAIHTESPDGFWVEYISPDLGRPGQGQTPHWAPR